MGLKDTIKRVPGVKTVWNAVKKSHQGIQTVFACKDIYRTKRRIIKRHYSTNKPIKVIFLVQYIPGWNKLEPLYRKMLLEKRFEPMIICVPLNIKNNRLENADELKNDTYDYFLQHGYSATNALIEKNTWVDLKALEPDYVFHSRPYNSFMPKQYTSRYIRKYALLCNSFYGANTTINGWQVTLNRDYFKDVYLYLAFDDSEKEFFENKFKFGTKLKIQYCIPYGAIGLENMLSVNHDSTAGLSVLWTPRWSTDSFIGGSNFFRYRDVMIQLVKDNPNISFVFRPHPLMFDNFINSGEMTQQEVIEFKEFCSRTPNLVLDEKKEYADTFWNTSVLITDTSGILPEYYITKKPIIYCHSNIDFHYTNWAQRIIKTCYEVNNKFDLEHFFYDIMNGKDCKLNERELTIHKLFPKANNLSGEVLEYLYSQISSIQ